MPCGLRMRISEDDLRSMARQRIAAGHLPVMVAKNLTAAYGSGEHCWLCEEPVELLHVGYQVRDIQGGALLVLHVICHSAWQLECASQTSSQVPPR